MYENKLRYSGSTPTFPSIDKIVGSKEIYPKCRKPHYLLPISLSSSQILQGRRISKLYGTSPATPVNLITETIHDEDEENYQVDDSFHMYEPPGRDSNVGRGAVTSLRTPAYMGMDALRSYHTKFKNYNRTHEILQMKGGGLRDSASMAYLENVIMNNRSPQPMGIVQRSTHKKLMGTTLDAKYNIYIYIYIYTRFFKMGDTYAEALSKGLRFKQIEKASLTENRLTSKGAKAIIAGFSPKLKYLNLSKNKIGIGGINCLCQYMQKDGRQYIYILYYIS